MQRERKNRKVGSVDMSELSISVQPIRRHNCEEWKCATNKNALRSQNCSWARTVRILLTYLPMLYSCFYFSAIYPVCLEISKCTHKILVIDTLWDAKPLVGLARIALFCKNILRKRMNPWHFFWTPWSTIRIVSELSACR